MATATRVRLMRRQSARRTAHPNLLGLPLQSPREPRLLPPSHDASAKPNARLAKSEVSVLSDCFYSGAAVRIWNLRHAERSRAKSSKLNPLVQNAKAEKPAQR